MSNLDFDIIIIGGGIFGCSTFYHLTTKTELRVALIDKGRIGAQGATAKTGAIYRSFDLNPLINDLAQASYQEYAHFQEITGFDNQFNQRGCLYSITPSHDLRTLIDTSSMNGFKVDIVSKENTSFGLKLDENNITLYDHSAGYMNPTLTCHGYAQAAIAAGGEVFESTEVLDFLQQGELCYGVETNKGIFNSNKFVITTGAEGFELLDKCDDGINYRNKLIQYIKAKITWKNKPAILPISLNDTTGYYLRPISDELLMIGRVIDEWDLDLKNLPPMSIEEKNAVLAYFEKTIIDCKSLNTVEEVVAYDLYTESRLGVFRSSKKYPNCFIATAWSGQGFKIAPEIAKKITKEFIDL